MIEAGNRFLADTGRIGALAGARLAGRRDVAGAGSAAERWADALTAAVEEGVELQHATRGLQRAEDVARNNCHDAHHHIWDIQRIAASSRRGPTPPSPR